MADNFDPTKRHPPHNENAQRSSPSKDTGENNTTGPDASGVVTQKFKISAPKRMSGTGTPYVSVYSKDGKPKIGTSQDNTTDQKHIESDSSKETPLSEADIEWQARLAERLRKAALIEENQRKIEEARANLDKHFRYTPRKLDHGIEDDIQKEIAEMNAEILAKKSPQKESGSVGPQPPKEDNSVPQNVQPINVSTTISGTIVDVDDEDDQPYGDGTTPKDDQLGSNTTYEEVRELITTRRFNFKSQDAVAITKVTMVEILKFCSFANLAFITKEQQDALIYYLSPSREYLPGAWSVLLQYTRATTYGAMTLAVYVAAYAYMSESVNILDADVGMLVATYIHMCFPDLIDFSMVNGEPNPANYFASLVYDAEDNPFTVSPLLQTETAFHMADLEPVTQLEENPGVVDNHLLNQLAIIREVIHSNPSRYTQPDIQPEQSKKDDSGKKSQQPSQPSTRPTTPVTMFATTPGGTKVQIRSNPSSPASSRKSGRTSPVLDIPEEQPLQRQRREDVHTLKSRDTAQIKKRKKHHDDSIQRALLNAPAPLPRALLYDASTKTTVVEIIDEDKFLKRYGDNCIWAAGTQDVQFQRAPDDQPSNILGVLASIVNSSFSNYSVTDTDDYKGHVLGTIISLPHTSAPFRQLFANESFPMTLRKDLNPQVFNIQSTGPIQIPAVTRTITKLTTTLNNDLDPKLLAGSIQNVIAGTSEVIAKGLTNQVQANAIRYSMFSLFTRMWTLFFMLTNCEELNIEPRFINLIHDDIENINMSATAGQANIPLNNLIRAMGEGRPMLSSAEVSSSHIQCMRLISAGNDCIHTPEAANDDLVGSFFRWEESVRWSIMGREGSLPAKPANINVSSAMMLDFIRHMADRFGRPEDMVNGFIRASLLMTLTPVSVRTKTEGVSTRTMNSMLEMYATTMPATRCDNPIWRLLDLTGIVGTPSSIEEAKVLTARGPAFYGHLFTAVASSISLGFSHVFHSMSITGSVLTSTARNVAKSTATTLIRDMTMCPINEQIPVICRLACGYLPQISHMTYNPKALAALNWSGMGVTLAASNPTHSWRRLYPCWVPYLAQPTALLYMGLKLDSNWGISQANIRISLDKEVQTFEDRRYKYWSAALGSDAYAQYAKDSVSYMNIPYGPLVMNAVQQQCRVHVARRQRFIKMGRQNATASYVMSSRPQFWEDYEQDIIPELYMHRIGSILNYDWGTESVMVPALLLDEQPAIIAALFEVVGEHLIAGAGLIYTGAMSSAVLSTNLEDALNFKRFGMKATAPPKVETKPEPTKVDSEVAKVVAAVPTVPVVTKTE